VTDHLGALLLAPLNIAWLIQSWSLLGATAFVSGGDGLPLVAFTCLLWILMSTTLGQFLAWCVELVRRGRHGIAVVRALWLTLGLVVFGLVATGSLGHLLDRLPSAWIIVVVYAPTGGGAWGTWAIGLIAFIGVAVTAVCLGGVMATTVNRRAPREEATAEGRVFTPLSMPGSDLGALVRTDRASVCDRTAPPTQCNSTSTRSLALSTVTTTRSCSPSFPTPT
jgi:hypothetical protein